MKRYVCLLFLFTGLLTATPSRAQLVEEFTHPRSPCCPTIAAQALADRAQAAANQAADWAEIGYYHQENLKLENQPVEKGRVVFRCDQSSPCGGRDPGRR